MNKIAFLSMHFIDLFVILNFCFQTDLGINVPKI